jgi:hypothetical protein
LRKYPATGGTAPSVAPTNRLCHEGHHLIGAQTQNFILQLLRQTCREGIIRLLFTLLTIGITGRQMANLAQQRLELTGSSRHFYSEQASRLAREPGLADAGLPAKVGQQECKTSLP